MSSLCGADCKNCPMVQTCKGCAETNGHPFGGNCVLVECCYNKNDNTLELIKEYKNKLIGEINALNIKDMPKLNELYSLRGSFVNVEFNLENEQNIKFLNDNDIYLGNQLQKTNSVRCYGIAANDKNILVCEYGENCKDPEIIIYKKR